MGHITLRTNEEEDTAIAQLLIATGEKTASSAIKKAIHEYEKQQKEVKRLKGELFAAECAYSRLLESVTAFRDAQNRLFNSIPE